MPSRSFATRLYMFWVLVAAALLATVTGAAADTDTEARRVANLAAYERGQSGNPAIVKNVAETAVSNRLAAERTLSDRAARKAAEERATAAHLSTAVDRKKRDAEAMDADVDRILQRALLDYPFLATPEGEPWLRRIMEKQQALVGRGVYPSIAMVEAISDHAHTLTPRHLQEPRAVPASATARQPTESLRLSGGCRWVTSTQWACT